jgi:hypothetical protein
MQQKIGICKECNNDKKIILANSHFNLCDYHNKLRLSPNKKIYIIKQISSKQAKKNKVIARIYEEMDKGEQICSGCHRQEQLTHSHLIPRSWNKELEAEPENIKFHCLACHQKWEGTLEQKRTMFDFEKNIEYIKSVDNIYYNKILNR